MTANAFLSRLGIEHPILLAPMAGSGGTPELAAAVSNAGGLGAWGGAYAKPEEIAAAIRHIRQLTSRPFSINLFAGGYETDRKVDPQPMLEIMRQAHARLGLPPPALPPVPANPFDEQFAAVLEERPPVFSFTFGMLSSEQIAAPFEDSMIPVATLVRDICASVALPVIASGGIMDGRDVAAAMKLGAAAVQLGTAFLPCPESGAPAVYKRALLEAKNDTTVITRAFSGRPARGIANTFIAMVAGNERAILPFRQQNDLTRPMRNAAGQQGVPDFISLWAGQGVARSRAMPAGELVKLLVEESSVVEVGRP